MMKSTLFLILNLFFGQITFSQVEGLMGEIGIEILETEITGSRIPRNIAPRLTELLKTELSNCQRFKAVDARKIAEVITTLNRQKEEEYRNQNTVRQGHMQVTHFQLKCNLLEYGVEKVYSEDSKTKRKEFQGYKAWMSYSYDLTEILNGTTVLSKVIKVRSQTKDSKEEAISNMTAEAYGWLKRFLILAFPVKSELLKTSLNKKKNKLTKVTLAGGAEQDVFKGCRFKVLRITEVKGQSGKVYKEIEELGTLKVKNLKSQTCDAKPVNSSSAKNILKYIKKGETLYVMSYVSWPDPDKPATIEGYFQKLNPFNNKKSR